MNYFWSCNSNFDKKYYHGVLFFSNNLRFFRIKPTSVKEELTFKLNNTRGSILDLLIPDVRFFKFLLIKRCDFNFGEFCLNLLHHMERCRFGSVIIQIKTKINQKQHKQIRQSSMKQYFTQISSSHELLFCLARKLLVFYQKTVYLAESYLIFTDGLLDLQQLDEIKFYTVLCKTYIAGIWLVRTINVCHFFVARSFTFIKPFST